jgi:hypothetical protein
MMRRASQSLDERPDRVAPKQRSPPMSEENDARPKKRAKKKNALKHGVYSREVMLPGENIRGYEALVAEFMEEWAPEGPTERSLVDRLVGLHWRRQRLDRYEHSKLELRVKEVHFTNEVNRHKQNLKRLGLEFDRANSVEAVEKILCRLSPYYSNHIREKVPCEEAQDTVPWGPAIGKYLATFQPIDQLEGPAKFIAMVDPHFVEKDMERSDRMDEAIDRTIKRLMQIKTAKQIFPKMRNTKTEPKLINVPAVTGPSAQANENEQNGESLGKVEGFAKPNPSSLAVPIDYNEAKLRIG